MKRWMYLFVMSIAVMLQACTSPKMSEEYTEGKVNFAAGNYKRAFHSLLPVAAKGKPEAQYAVGYMYYYGYGTSQDEESGLFWMTKAAEQNYEPAQQALAMINNQPPPPSPPPPERIKTNAAWEKSVSEIYVAPPKKKKHFSHPVTSEASESPAVAEPSTQKVLALFSPSEKKTSENGKSFSLQLMGDYDMNKVKNLQATLHLKGFTSIWRTQHNGRDWYILTYGKFTSPHEAKVALAKANNEVKDLKPWVKKMENVTVV